MRTIDADTLMPSFIKKANTMKDRHGVKLGEDWLLNYNDIQDVIDNAPTIDDLSEYSDKLWKKAYERGKAERPTEVNCSHCDYFKFSQSFIENIVKLMTDYNIESVEDLMRELNHINELLGGRE